MLHFRLMLRFRCIETNLHIFDVDIVLWLQEGN